MRALGLRGASTGRLAGLGALSVADACERMGLKPSIKWPNDVLLESKKVSGILVEARWSGDALEFAVVGVGINVLAGSAPPSESVRFPPTTIEDCLGRRPDRLHLLRLVVSAFVRWHSLLGSEAFMQAWSDRLAFRGKRVVVSGDDTDPVYGEVDGLESDGSLRLITRRGAARFAMGELQLAVDDTIV